MNFYEEMGQVASELLADFSQGTIVYQEPPTTSGPDYNPVVTPGAEHSVAGIKVSGHRKNTYVEGGYIQASDLMIMLPVFAAAPELSGTMTINGKTYQIIMVDPITEEVPPVGWYIGCRA